MLRPYYELAAGTAAGLESYTGRGSGLSGSGGSGSVVPLLGGRASMANAVMKNTRAVAAVSGALYEADVRVEKPPQAKKTD